MRRTVGHQQANVGSGQLVGGVAARIDEGPGPQPRAAVEVVGDERRGGGRGRRRRSAEGGRRRGRGGGGDEGLRRGEGVSAVGAIGGDPEAILGGGGEVGQEREMRAAVAGGGGALGPGAVGGAVEDRAASGEGGGPADGGVSGASGHLEIGDGQRGRDGRRVRSKRAAEDRRRQHERNSCSTAHISHSRLPEQRIRRFMALFRHRRFRSL
ncbi:MAG: hypothetical protein RMJ48_09145 [Roseiflexaceae bacterium]|nr:hypothetical protein [Roseiflexaceae bacterium]